MAGEEFEWLGKEVPKWVEKGWISQSQGDQILSYYPSKSEDSNLPFVLLSGIATLLIGSGLILIVSNNWSGLTTSLRTVISFIPILMGILFFGYTQLYRFDEVAWRESGATFVVLMLAASLGLFAQTQQVLTDSASFLQAWMYLSIPVMYLGQSTLVALIYMGGVLAFSAQDYSTWSGWYWILLAPAIPMLFIRTQASRFRLRRGVLEIALLCCLITGWFAHMELQTTIFGCWGTALFLTVIWGWGAIQQIESGFTFTPFRWIGVLGVYFMIMVLSSGVDMDPIVWAHWYAGDSLPWASARFNGWFLMLLGLGWLWLLAYFVRIIFFDKNKIHQDTDAILSMFPILVIGFIWIASQAGTDLSQLYMNVVGLLFGSWFLLRGLYRQAFFYVNIGLLFILTIMVLRFFDQSWDLVIKGFIFIGVGILFLGVNYWLYLKRKERLTPN